MDGHDETSIPPYNFVARGIKITGSQEPVIAHLVLKLISKVYRKR
jgi:hypothetical protein